MKSAVRMGLCLAAVWAMYAATAAFGAAKEESGRIYVVGALHGLHARVPGFDFAELRRIVEAIDPEVMLLETRPDELSQRTDTPGRPEYPRVIWPYLAANSSVTAVAMEPQRALFDLWVGEASAAFAGFRERDPAAHAYWTSYQETLAQLLPKHWKGPADAHDRASADIARSRYLVQYGLAGESLKRGQERWDAYMVERALEVARENPARRILVLASYRNRHRFDEALRKADIAEVVDMEAWLRGTPARR